MDLIQKTIQASGGAIWRRPQTLRLSGAARFTPFGQLEDQLFFDRYELFRVFPTQSRAARKANGKVRIEAHYGEETFFQLAFDGQDSQVFLSEVAKPYAEYFRWSNNFGFGILRFAEEKGFDVKSLVEDQAAGYPVHMIRIRDLEGRDTFFGIDQSLSLIRMVGFTTALGWHHRIYEAYEAAENGFMQAQRVKIYFEGIKWLDIFWKEYEVNQPITDRIFQLK